MTEQTKWVGKGRQIISAVLIEHGVHPDDFFGHSRIALFVTARRDAATRLRAAGFSTCQAGRIMKRDHSTIINYSPESRKGKRQYYGGKRLLSHLADDVREIVIAAAIAEGTTPYTLMAGWIAERATYEAEAKSRVAA